MRSQNRSSLSFLLFGVAAWVLSSVAYGVDAESAKELATQNNCLKCHVEGKESDGPPYKKVAAKYKGKAGAEARLIEHIMSGEKATFPDGHLEDHKIVRTMPPKDMAQIKNLVQWVLSH